MATKPMSAMTTKELQDERYWARRNASNALKRFPDTDVYERETALANQYDSELTRRATVEEGTKP